MTEAHKPQSSPQELREAGRLDWWWAESRHDTLCTYTLERVTDKGECPVHGGDACLYVFARVADIERALNA